MSRGCPWWWTSVGSRAASRPPTSCAFESVGGALGPRPRPDAGRGRGAARTDMELAAYVVVHAGTREVGHGSAASRSLRGGRAARARAPFTGRPRGGPALVGAAAGGRGRGGDGRGPSGRRQRGGGPGPRSRAGRVERRAMVGRRLGRGRRRAHRRPGADPDGGLRDGALGGGGRRVHRSRGGPRDDPKAGRPGPGTSCSDVTLAPRLPDRRRRRAASGVEVGEEALVAAGAVVTRDVPAPHGGDGRARPSWCATSRRRSCWMRLSGPAHAFSLSADPPARGVTAGLGGAAVLLGEVGRVWRRGSAPKPERGREPAGRRTEEAVAETAQVAREGYRQVSSRENTSSTCSRSFATTFLVARLYHPRPAQPVPRGPVPERAPSAAGTSTISCPGIVIAFASGRGGDPRRGRGARAQAGRALRGGHGSHPRRIGSAARAGRRVLAGGRES